MNSVRKPLSWMALSGLSLGVGATAAAVISGLGYRLGWWHHSTGFDALVAEMVAADIELMTNGGRDDGPRNDPTA